MKHKPVTVLGFVLLLCKAAFVQADKVEDYIQSKMAEYHVPGAAVAVREPGQEVMIEVCPAKSFCCSICKNQVMGP
ncbi:MAG: hypothetical protein ACREOO_14685 [bacterium]